MNVYELLNRFVGRDVYVRTIGHLQTTAPRCNVPERIVKSNFDRGGFRRGNCTIPLNPKINRARLTARSMRDHNVTNAATDSYGFTSFVVGEFRDGRFQKVNDQFEARLNRELYDLLRENNACRETDNLNKLVLIDVSHLPLFPVELPNINYINDKINLQLALARHEKLYNIRTHARSFFAKQGIPLFDHTPRSPRASSALYRVVETYDKVSFEIEGQEIVAGIDDSRYRVKEGRSFIYSIRGYYTLLHDLAQAKAIIDALHESVRLREMSYLEQLGTTIVVSNPDGPDYVINRIVEDDAKETHYNVLLSDAIRYVESNPSAVILDANKQEVSLEQARETHANAVAESNTGIGTLTDA